MSVTIKDVAKAAGTSIGTVSKALNGSYTISEETKKRIQNTAKQMQYRPNAQAQTLARQAGRKAAFLTYLPRDIGFTNPHMFEILAGAEKALAAKEYTLSLQGCNPKTACGLAKSIMEHKSADGLLLHASVVTRELAAMITREGLPHIVIGMPPFTSRLCWIDSNNHLAGEIAAHHLLDTGHRHLAFIGGRAEDKISQARLEGVLSELDGAGIERGALRVYQGESTTEEGITMTAEMLEDGVVDGVICANNYLALGCLEALRERRIAVPNDISIVTFDSYPFAQLTNPKLTTVSIDVFEIGLSAGKLLMNKIRKPNLQVQSFTTLPNLVVRGSTRTEAHT